MTGGRGSLAEFFETLNYVKLGLHSTPCGLLNYSGSFSGRLRFLEQVVSHGLLKREFLSIYEIDNDQHKLLEQILDYLISSRGLALSEEINARNDRGVNSCQPRIR